MFGVSSSYIVGYEDGKSSEKYGRTAGEFWNRIFRRGPVTVDQSYIDSLHAHLQNAQATAQHNERVCKEWIAQAEKLEQEVAALKSQVDILNRVTAERNGLLKFLDMAGHLLQAQREGKASRPEFAELREFALQVAGIHLDGGIYEGLADQPKKMAWLRKVWEALR
jgi:hypothetical protein